MQKSYNILVIDLLKEDYYVDKIDKTISDFYLGGYGIGLYWLNTNRKINDCFMVLTTSNDNYYSPINKYIIMAYEKGSKIKYGNMGGDFSYYLKDNGYDGLILLNKAKSLKKIYINKDNIDFKTFNNDSHNEVISQASISNEDRFSSLYISESAMRGDLLARLLADNSRGVSKNLANKLFYRNVYSINIAANRNKKARPYPTINPNSSCQGCPIGCQKISKKSKPTIFSIQNGYTEDDINLIKNIKIKIDQYGIDLFGLGKSIKYAYENLNDTYKFENLDPKNLDYIVNKILDKNREQIYEDLAMGLPYLKMKYIGEDKLNNQSKKKENEFIKIIDSACICLFSVDANDLEDISHTLSLLRNKTYTINDLSKLSIEIKKLESNLS